MPVEVQNNSLYEVRNFGVDKKNGSYEMYLSCPKASAFILCFSKGDEPIDCTSLGLLEDELAELHQGKIIERNNCRLQGVASYTLTAMTSYKDFTVNPPERIQVWSMFRDAFGNITLFATNEAAVCYIPLEYEVSINEVKDRTYLSVKIDSAYLEGYENGALGYRIGNSDAIPIPKNWINKNIPLMPGVGNRISVVAQSGQEHKYRLLTSNRPRI